MSHTERILKTISPDNPRLYPGVRVAPNEGTFPTDATVFVETEDGHDMIFKMYPKGPSQADYLISLVYSEPPISGNNLMEKEVYVKNDVMKKGETFQLDSAFPILAQTAFVALSIQADVETIVLPPTQSIPIIQESAFNED